MLGGINDRLNALAWELASQNESIGDPNVSRAIGTMDEALENLQVAAALLNTVAVDPALFEEDADTEVVSKSKNQRGFLKRKAQAEPTVS